MGREQETEWLVGRLKEGHGVALCARGLGGVGKTALATHAGHKLYDHFSGGIAWVEMHGARGPALGASDAMRQVIRYLDATADLPSDDAALQQAYRRTLEGRNLLVVLDDAPDDPAAVQALQPPPDNALLVTSRFNIAFPGLEPCDLDVLDADSAKALLRHEAGRDIGDDDADAIVRRCGHLPLAVSVAGAQLAGDPTTTPGEYLKALDSATARWKALRLEGVAKGDVKGVLGLSLERLREQDPDAAARWPALAVFPQDFDRCAAAAVWACSEEDAKGTLRTLSCHALMQVDSGRFWLHDLLRDLAWEQAPDLTDARQRHAVHFREVLQEANETYKQGHANVLAGLQRFDRDRRNIEAGQDWAAANAEVDDTAQWLCAAYPLAGVLVLVMRLPVATQRDWDATGLAAAEARGDREQECRLAGNLGVRYRKLGQPETAIPYQERRRDIAREIGDRKREAQSLVELGNAYKEVGWPEAAWKNHEAALAIKRDIGDQRGEGMSLNCLGNLAQYEADPDKAFGYYGPALEVYRVVGHRRGEGMVLQNMGLAHEDLEQLTAARDRLQQALAIREELDDPETENTRTALARVDAKLSGGGSGADDGG